MEMLAYPPMELCQRVWHEKQLYQDHQYAIEASLGEYIPVDQQQPALSKWMANKGFIITEKIVFDDEKCVVDITEI